MTLWTAAAAMMMHAPMGPVPHAEHPICAEFMAALSQCCKDNSIAVWWGACSSAKMDLSACLAAAAEQQHPRAQQQAKDQAVARQQQLQQQKQRQERERREVALRTERAELEADCFTIFAS